MQTTFNREDKPRTATGAADFKKKIGSTTYLVSVYFSKASTETIEDKILRLLEREGKKTA